MAADPPPTTAAKRAAKVKKGDKVLVIGASGAVGSAAVQIAKHAFGASVTGVTSRANADIVRSLGADEVIDYAERDALLQRAAYDVVVDTVGDVTIARAWPALKPRGRLVLVAGDVSQLLRMPFYALASDKKVVGGPSVPKTSDMAALRDMVQRGEFRPLVGRTFAFEQIGAAHEAVDSRHKRGSVVVKLV